MTLKNNGKEKSSKRVVPKSKVKCPYCHKNFKVTDYEIEGKSITYYCDYCNGVFTDKQI